MNNESEQHEKITIEQMEKTFSDIAFEFATNPRNIGHMEGADGFAKITGPCGDTMQIWLKIKERIITGALFTTDGCGNAIAACSMTTELSKNKSIVEAKKIGQKDILAALGGLPEEGKHCALLAANTLKSAIQNYLIKTIR